MCTIIIKTQDDLKKLLDEKGDVVLLFSVLSEEKI